MDIQAYRDEIKFKLTGGIVRLEIPDEALDMAINSALREIQRYICSTRVVTIPYERCIDVKDFKINSISRIYRVDGYSDGSETMGSGPVDPMYAAQWQLLSGTGTLYNFQDYVYDFASWNTLLQIRNTISTDLAYIYDKDKEKLYINVSSNFPKKITIEFVPVYSDVSEIKSDFWIDMLMRLALAITKQTLGRIRSKYSQSNALWGLDGDKLLEEGNNELNSIREYLETNTQLIYPID